MSADATNPSHYKRLDPEPITVIEAWKLDFCIGNAVKYLARAGFKDGQSRDLDLAKARWYVERAMTSEPGEGFPIVDLDNALGELAEAEVHIDNLQRELDQWRATARAMAPVKVGLIELRDAPVIEICRRCFADGFKGCQCETAIEVPPPAVDFTFDMSDEPADEIEAEPLDDTWAFAQDVPECGEGGEA